LLQKNTTKRVDPYPTRPVTGQNFLTHTRPIYFRVWSDRVRSDFYIPNIKPCTNFEIKIIQNFKFSSFSLFFISSHPSSISHWCSLFFFCSNSWTHYKLNSMELKDNSLIFFTELIFLFQESFICRYACSRCRYNLFQQ
jgi:hypothetical protein